jgi:hypothetical protein
VAFSVPVTLDDLGSNMFTLPTRPRRAENPGNRGFPAQKTVEHVGQHFRVNDPSAGSPTETLLRLLLPLDDQICTTSRNSGPENRPRATVRGPH